MTVGEVEAETPAPRSRATISWFAKRLILGVLILVISIGGLAWLLHAAIDPGPTTAPESLLDVMGRLASQF